MNAHKPKHPLRAKHKADQARLDKAVDIILKGVPPELTREQILISRPESAPCVLLGDDACPLKPSGEVSDAIGQVVALAIRSDWIRQHFDPCAFYYVK